MRTEKFVSAEQTTKDSGILHIKPKAIIDDYVFEPCGYSMNGIDGEPRVEQCAIAGGSRWALQGEGALPSLQCIRAVNQSRAASGIARSAGRVCTA